MSKEIANQLIDLLRGFDRRVHAAADDAWGNPSPCEGWTATDVVMHVATNVDNMAAALTGGDAAALDAADPVGSWNASSERLLSTLATADLSTPVPGPVGLMPAEQIIERLMSVDVLVHTWDLARAVGGDESLPEADVLRAYNVMEPMDAVIRMPGVFGPKVPVDTGVPLQTELLHFLGRAV
jgi:uncharacterized protein (TIGR03086 family)